MSKELEGQGAIVTGASRGIGKAVALRLAASGAHVALVARGLAGSEKRAGELRGKSPSGRFPAFACDVSDSKAVGAIMDSVLKELGRVDVLVNNAGITRDNLLLRMSEAEWDEVGGANLKGLFNFSKAVARHMLRERKGRIVNVTSIVGLIGNPGQANYAASKGGVIAFTFSLAKELAS